MHKDLNIDNTYLYHYYENSNGALKTISDMKLSEAQSLLNELSQNEDYFAGKRDRNYLTIRLKIEKYIRNKFITLGGNPILEFPHYFTLEKSDWLKTWYPNPACIKIPLSEIDSQLISFTYGDTFPAFRYKQNNPTRGKIFTTENIFEAIDKYGLPQRVNPNGDNGPIRYIEAQLWYNLNE
ncbi:MAG: hypothetical protein OCD02_08400 [Spirochaetaceae bacterium]